MLITEDRRYFDLLHPVLPTALPIREFVDCYAKLYRRSRSSVPDLLWLVHSGHASLSGAIEYAMRLPTLADPATYRSAIELDERKLAGELV